MLRSLRTQILLWTILPLAVVLIGVAYLGVNSHQAAMRAMVAERDGSLARVAAAQVSELLSDRARELVTMDVTRPETWDTKSFDGGVALFDVQNIVLQAVPNRELWQTRAVNLPREGQFSAPYLENGMWRVLVTQRVDQGVLVGAGDHVELSGLLDHHVVLSDSPVHRLLGQVARRLRRRDPVPPCPWI